MTPAADPLALPPVPPPAPGAHRLRDAAVALGFFAAIALAGLAALRTPKDPALEYEFRNRAPWPAFEFTRAFPARFERAFADRFGGRGTLLRLHHAAMVTVFGVSPAPNVMLGRDRWLYFLGEDGRSLARHYLGTQPFGDDEIEAAIGEFVRRQQFLAAHGVAYVVVIVPDKYTIYPEHLPAWVGPPRSPTPLARLAAAIAADGRVHFIDLRPLLTAAKADRRVYYATDSHWNLLGAAVGYEAIMRDVQQQLPPGRLPRIAPPALPPYVEGSDVYAGDLARQVGFPPGWREPDYAPFWKVTNTPDARCAKRVDGDKEPGVEAYECANAALPRALVFRDSMAIALIPLLSENFSRSVYVSDHRLDPALVLREKPDVVIDEMVERSMHAPAALPMPETK